ncbi:unnamed protein product [Candidula unifasciata]|uniref:Phospholipid/glycerol acyltransferase domain-containing protein n=1 Tax=Candidula unifasciata TaxID=100452 RepID=A0A8S3YHK1_9EUPU|nr:unnamed protein product [Candidula unifasciata]
MSFKNMVSGCTMVGMLQLSCTIGTIVLITPTLPLIFLSPKLGRRVIDFLIKLWFLLAVALYELLMGVKIVITGKPSRRGASCLILANHRTRLDWFFLMSYICRYSAIDQYRISLKESLKKVPGAGWAMQCAGFLFLKRKWEEDKDHISDCINYFSKVKSQPQFLLFPEGTDMCPNAIRRSNTFAEKQGLPNYEYVLHPRTTGFVHFVTEMKKAQILDSVLDVTVGYPKTLIQSEVQTLKGKFPEEIHFYVEDHPIDTLPDSEKELELWLTKLWSAKEARLNRFYTVGHFETDTSDYDISAIPKPISEVEFKKTLYGIILFWVIFLITVSVALYISRMFQIYCLLSGLTYVLIYIRHGGIDRVLYSSVKQNH